MANLSLSSFDRPRALLPWPLGSKEGAAATFASQIQQPFYHLGQWGLLAPQRTKPSRRVADFSIRSILALDGSEGERESHEEPAGGTMEWGGSPQGYTWVRCTRFKPLSVPKMKQVGCSPQLASRSPRVPFSATQLGTLENSFQQARYLSTEQVREVALLLGLTENRVKIWFQNRRARERRDFLKQNTSSSTSSTSMKGNPPQGQSTLGWRSY
ncbi:homeobox protein MSX-1-like [Rhineura floridana]|uniref:homeobox protein MSX-1-like n=1 Tax=Rhineura floridana TaxID=261503 RepID=UPI002AC88A0D|nr:homeobox protein MSX-1-like [Rhineura floridana]